MKDIVLDSFKCVRNAAFHCSLNRTGIRGT